MSHNRNNEQGSRSENSASEYKTNLTIDDRPGFYRMPYSALKRMGFYEVQAMALTYSG